MIISDNDSRPIATLSPTVFWHSAVLRYECAAVRESAETRTGSKEQRLYANRVVQ